MKPRDARMAPIGPGRGKGGYTIWSRIHIDEVTWSHAAPPEVRLGGAGVYAALGARMAVGAGPYVGVLAAVGTDFFPQYGGWFSDWDIDVFPGALRSEATPRSRLVYVPEAERAEYPALGEEHFDLFDVGVADVPEARLRCKGLYVFRKADRGFWDALEDSRDRAGTTVLWEIDRRSCDPGCWPDVARVLRSVDVFSINRAEASALCGPGGAVSPLERLRSAFEGALLYRMGPCGSYVAWGPRLLHVPAAPGTRSVDPTGAGNAYGGAFLALWCESGGDLEGAARMATAVATLVVGQRGPLDHVDGAFSAPVKELARRIQVGELSEQGEGKE